MDELGEEDDALEGAARELGGGDLPAVSSSPARTAASREKKRKTLSVLRNEDEDPLPSKIMKNSQMFSKEKRPGLFQDDEMFDMIPLDRAAKVCYKHSLEEEKKKLLKQKKNASEKADDVIKKVNIPEGDDDAKDVLNIEARKLRPVVKEISKCMDWFPTVWEEVVRNLPLSLYGMQDCVSTKAIELVHDLTSTIEIKMFSPANLRSSATNKMHKAFTNKEGKLVVEQNDVYEEIVNTTDVLMAWNTLDCLYQKLFPEWPTAKIAMRVLLTMKMFSHCGNKAKDVMVAYSNKYLAASASRAANRESPMDFERWVQFVRCFLET